MPEPEERYQAHPWKLCPATFIVHLPEGRKDDHCPTELRATALLDIAGLDDPETITAYTDGSVDPITDKAGSGLVLHKNYTKIFNQALHVPDGSSTLQAELYAILMALEAVKEAEEKTLLICTDSLGSIQALKQHAPQDNHELLAHLHKLLNERDTADKETLVYWVPSHVGVPGNEAADTEAKKALQLTDIEYIPVSRGNQKTLINRFCKPPPPDLTSNSVALYTQRVGSTTQMYPKDATRPIQTDINYTRLAYKLYREKPFGRDTAAAPCPDCREDYSYLHFFLQCTAHRPDTLKLLQELHITEDPDEDTEQAIQKIIQKSAQNPAPLIQFLTRWPVPHFERDDDTRLPDN